MQRYIAFLRAINVGGHTVKMEYLRALFEAMEFSGVSTFIASGNVIFEAPSASPRTIEELIEKQLKSSLGYEVPAFVRSARELSAIAAYQPFPTEEAGAEGASLYVAFLHQAPSDAVCRSLRVLSSATDYFVILEREIYWLCRINLSDSRVFKGGLFEKAIKVPVTMRNITTIRKLAAKYPTAN